MAVIDRVKWDGTPDILAWKYPSEELSTYTQLIVNESQEAFVVSGGVYDGPFGAGRHTLSTENIPLIRGLLGLPFGGRSPFSAEVWFVNRVANLDVRWGTPDPIQLQDPKFQIMVPVRAYGQYGVRIADSKKFLLKLVGTLPAFDAATLSEYLRGVFITRIKTDIANAIIAKGISVLEVSTQLGALSDALKVSLAPAVEEYGVCLAQFNIHSINVPENDLAVVTLRKALARRAEMGIVGYSYQEERSFDVMQSAARNEGTAGNIMGAGLGLGMGAAMGGSLGAAFGKVMSPLQPESQPPSSQAPSPNTGVSSQNPTPGTGSAPLTMSHDDRLRLLKELAELKASGVLTEEEFAREKQRLLAN